MNGDGHDPHLVTAQFAVAYIAVILPDRPTISEEQIRQWASRGRISRQGAYWTGRVGQNPTVYDINEIIAYVKANVPKR